ncbi:MAG TPA: hypothetical protein VFZ13_05320 [Gemmatimonadales bacterium]
MCPTRLLRLLLLLVVMAIPAVAHSQSSTPFGTVALSLGSALEIDRSSNLVSWDGAPGIEARVLLPFYLGSVELGATQSSYRSIVAGVPGFRARYVFIGWNAGARPARRLVARAGTRIGVYDLQFDDESLPDYSRSENEVAAELMTEIDLGLGRRWSAVAGAGGRIVFTEPRMRQLSLSLALRRTFAAPEWLRDFLD